MNKRGQGLSLETIIIAIIVIVVLVVLILIFTGRMGLFSSNANSCIGIGAKCCGSVCPEGSSELPKPDKGYSDCSGHCCVGVPATTTIC